MTPEIPFSPPPENLEPADGEIHVFCASLDQPPARMEQLTELLSEDERARASRLVFERDSKRYIAGRGMLREILGWLLLARPDGLIFSHGLFGKPQLAPAARGNGLQFNLAHSDSLAVYAVSRRHEIGVDVELIRPIPEAGEIAAQFFSEHECVQWRSLPRKTKMEAFFNCWVRKEAWLKARGEGIRERLDQIEVFFAGDFSDGTMFSLCSRGPR